MSLARLSHRNSPGSTKSSWRIEGGGRYRKKEALAERYFASRALLQHTKSARERETKRMASSLPLPKEILVQVAEHLDKTHDLLPFASTCKSFLEVGNLVRGEKKFRTFLGRRGKEKEGRRFSPDYLVWCFKAIRESSDSFAVPVARSLPRRR